MAMAVPEAVETRRFTAEEVWRMVEVGLLGPDEPFELINGQLRKVSPQGPRHANAIRALSSLLTRIYGPRYQVGVQLPIGGIDDSIPEPDVAVTEARDIEAPHPTAREAVLLIEVSDTSLRVDGDKRSVYARAGCPEYWMVDIPGQRVIVHRRPQPDGSWEHVYEVGRDASVTLPGTGELLHLADVMPRTATTST